MLKAELAEKRQHLQKKKNPVTPRQRIISHLSGCHGEKPQITVSTA
jgi:hypothetical protein